MNPIREFIAANGLQDPEYLVDGIYAAHDGYQTWLLVEREFGVIHSIALEPGAIRSIQDYDTARRLHK